jgi:hypothetical protein
MSMKIRLARMLKAFWPFAAIAWTAETAHAATITFNDLSDPTGLHLLGSAATTTTADGKVLRVTPDSQFQSGAAYSTTPIQLGGSFTSTFQVRLTHAGQDRADGMTFVMASTPNGLGANGGGLGYRGIGSSVALEFDTFINPAFDDPNNNHLGFLKGGSVQTLSSASPGFDLANGDIVSVKIDYARNGADDTLRVFLNGSDQAALGVDIAGGLDALVGGNSVFLGFTGATGGFSENADILNWQVTSVDPIQVPEPWTSSLAVAGLIGLGIARRRKRHPG